MLTDEQLRHIHHEDQFGLFCDYDEFEQIARTIEQAATAPLLARIVHLEATASTIHGRSATEEYVWFVELERDAARWRYALADGGNQRMNWLDVYDDWDGDGDFADAIDAAMKEQSHA